jgi:subtilase family serine protease
VVAGITYAPATGILPNQEVTFTATIQNNGAGPAVDSFQVEFRIGGASIGNKTVSQTLSGGEYTQLTQTWTAAAGEHTIEVMADSAGTVNESDEDNNSLSQILPDIIDPTPRQ